MYLRNMMLFIFLLIVTSCNSTDSNYTNDYTKYVDPFIGTGGHGHTFPGAMVPFGLVQVSPDTRMENWDGSSGYHYSDKTIMGFSHTHLSGTGAPEFCDILLMPTIGKVKVLVGDENNTKTGYRSKFSHNNEFASPGYYKVKLDDYNILAELTATTRSGMHKYTFPKSDSANIIIDLQNRDRVLDSKINIINKNEISGFRRSIRWAKDQHVYFYAKFSKPFENYNIFLNDKIENNVNFVQGINVKASLNYITDSDEQIFVKVGISSVSIEGAKQNLEVENKNWNFDKIRNDANEKWKNHLAKIDIEGGTEKERRIFYTSLYHTAMAPIKFNDVDGKYRGVDKKIHNAKGFTRYSVFSLWDVFRTQMPLYNIIEPSRMNDYIKTFLQAYKIGGHLPRWEIWGEYSAMMIGFHSLPVILDAYNKGINDFDHELAFKAMKNEIENVNYYSNLGYFPADKSGGSVSKIMEYAYNDWCISEMAKNLNKENDRIKFLQRSQFYKNNYDKSTGFMRPKKLDRSWVTPFDPAEGTEHFVEGNSFQYSLFAPHDINGLISLIGGNVKFEKWLDHLFTYKSDYDENVIDASGLIGQYAHGNEPSHHMAYLYNYSGAPHKTQSMVRRILNEMYDDKPNGLEGNEDCGQMSAWYVLSAMGFYPVTPGSTTYNFGCPIFSKVTINLENGEKFVIEANNSSSDNYYIQSASLNGKNYSKSWFNHEEIINGGIFKIEMGSTPSKWGSSKNDRPYTQKYEKSVSLPYVISEDNSFIETIKVQMDCETKDSKIFYTIDGTEPTKNSKLYKNEIVIDKTVELKIKAFKDNLIPSVSVNEKFKKLEYESYRNYSGKNLKRGLRYKYYESKVMFVKEIEKLTPSSKGIINSFNIKLRKKNENFCFDFNGYIKIPKDGKYTFFNKTNDGSILYLDGKEFINLDGAHPAFESFKTIALKKGFYKISQKYFQMAGGYMNKVSWKGPGIEKQEIPSSVLFHVR